MTFACPYFFATSDGEVNEKGEWTLTQITRSGCYFDIQARLMAHFQLH